MNQGFRENLRKYVDPLGDLGIRALRDVGFFDYWISRHPETGSIILDEVKRSPEYREAIGFELTDQKTVLDLVMGFSPQEREGMLYLIEAALGKGHLDIEKRYVSPEAVNHFAEVRTKAAMLRGLLRPVVKHDIEMGGVLRRMASEFRKNVMKDTAIDPHERELVLTDPLDSFYNMAGIAIVDLELGRIDAEKKKRV